MTSQQNACYLKWKDYPNYMQKMLKEMLTLDNFTDVTLVTDDKNQIKAHRSILSACSPVFKSIFQIKDDCNTPVVYLRGMQSSEIESILQFIYLGEAIFCEERLDEFLSVAKSLEMYKLCIHPDNEYGKVNISSEKIQQDASESRHHIKDDTGVVKNVALDTLDSAVELDNIQVTREEADCHESDESQELKMNNLDNVSSEGVLNDVTDRKSDCVQQQAASSKTKEIEYQESFSVKIQRQPDRENINDSNTAYNSDSLNAQNDNNFKEVLVENNQSDKYFQSQVINIKDKKWECPVCGKMFIRKHNLKSHLKVIHTGELPFDIIENFQRQVSALKETHRQFECPTCGKILTTKHGLEIHLRVHTGELPYECNQCGQKFADASNMNKHIRTYHEGVIYACRKCDYQARTEQTLYGHTMRHHVDPKYVCDQCDYKTWHHPTFTNHQLIHTDEKPFECETCGRKFRQKQQLQTHIRVHTGETPYKCQKCGKMFKFLATRDTHKCVVPQRQ